MSEIETIQVETTWWLILDGSRPRFVVHYGPAVHRETHETLMMYRLDAWTLERRDRWTVGHYSLLEEAVEVARERIVAPEFRVPIVDGYGTCVPPAVQRERWEAGLDPMTGEPLTR